MIRKVSGRWQVDVQPGGRSGTRIRKTFDTHGEAERFQRYVMGQSVTVPWNPPPADHRTVHDLVERWWELHGSTLRRGAERKRALLRIADRLPIRHARSLTRQVITADRAKRSQQVSADTVNHDIAYGKSMINALIASDEWHLENPFIGVKLLPKPERFSVFWTPEQCKRAIKVAQASKSEILPWVVELNLLTGCRWEEACHLQRHALSDGLITFEETKSGRMRAVPVPPTFSRRLKERCQQQGIESGPMFADVTKAFGRMVNKEGLPVSRGQLARVLRHTFASQFVINGGNILSLQKILGHRKIETTMIYAHLAPDHLRDALTLNPLALGRHLVDTSAKKRSKKAPK